MAKSKDNGFVGSWDVSIPVTVFIDDGKVVGMSVDYEDAPWPFVSAGGNVWDPLTEEWTTDEEIAGYADMYLQGVIDDLGLPGPNRT